MRSSPLAFDAKQVKAEDIAIAASAGSSGEE